MSDLVKGDLMERLERLERANRWWRLVSCCAVVTVLVVCGYTFSQREQQKPPTQAAQPVAGTDFPIERSQPPTVYANFARVSVTPEELILDLGLNTQMTPDANNPIRISQRVVMNYFTAKRLAVALQQVVQQYETTYGPLELDFEKRMVPGAKAPPGK
jgi:hypothetical protein